MTTGKDIRWQQRFSNYSKALSQLSDAVNLSEQRALTRLEEQGLIQAFEYTHELAWKTLKDFLNEKGNNEIYGSKDATRVAFGYGIITEGEIWMDMIIDRNKTSHTYNQQTSEEITRAILAFYYQAFIALENKLKQLVN